MGFKAIFAGLAAASLGFGAAAQAQEVDFLGATLICTFSEECYETEACDYAEYTVDVALPDALPGAASLLPDTGPAEGTATALKSALSIAAQDANAAYLLTRQANGLARLSVHYGDPAQVITYHGQCDIAQ